MYEIIEELPLDGDKTPKERYYYAVDVVGNLSPALNLTYTYNNPHQAKNAEIIDFARIEKGEGLEKKEENFAEEVMKQINK